MSRVFKSVEAYERDVAERAKFVRTGGGTHAIQQQGVLAGDWVAPEGWVPPAVPEKEPTGETVSPARIDVVPKTHTTPPSTYDLQRLNYLLDEEEDYYAQ